ncbi:MAG: 17 kDa surface antigen [Polaromonas sp.]|nr:17 kDa surface antigen [Polaromonas sp.]
MTNAFVKTLVGSTVAAAGMACLPAAAMDILARVVSSTPVVQQVAVPRQVCNNEAVMTQAPKSGAGALMGALAGGAAGNAIGNGSGRAVATMIGLVGGAMVGDRIEGPNTQLQNVQQCGTQTYYENRPTHYNVVYEYQGTQYNTQMANDPGLYVRLQVSPVGAMTPAPQPNEVQAQQQTQPYYQPAPVVQPQPVYVQPVAVAPVVYPAYAPRPYYAPYYPPIGLSLNFGYSRGFGGHHRH